MCLVLGFSNKPTLQQRIGYLDAKIFHNYMLEIHPVIIIYFTSGKELGEHEHEEHDEDDPDKPNVIKHHERLVIG